MYVGSTALLLLSVGFCNMQANICIVVCLQALPCCKCAMIQIVPTPSIALLIGVLRRSIALPLTPDTLLDNFVYELQTRARCISSPWSVHMLMHTKSAASFSLVKERWSRHRCCGPGECGADMKELFWSAPPEFYCNTAYVAVK